MWEGFYRAGAIVAKNTIWLSSDASLLRREHLEIGRYRNLRILEGLILVHKLLLDNMGLLR